MKNLLIALILCLIASIEGVEANGNSYKTLLANNSNVILDVYADGCPPCNQLAPVFQAVERELGSSYTFVKLNGRQNSQAASDLNVRGFPTLIFFKNGKEMGRQSGYVNHDQLTNLIKRYLQ